MFHLFITTAVGCEKELFRELEGLEKIITKAMGKGGVYADVASFEDIMSLNYVLHTANRVLVELCRFEQPTEKEIYDALYHFDWQLFFPRSQERTFAIEVPFSTHPSFTNTLFAAQYMKDPICDRLRKENGKRPNVDTKKPDIRFQALLTREEFRFYFDSSNEPLYKRGYKEQVLHRAPIKETLASALLMRAGFSAAESRFIDPCAGSGTFLMEALLWQYGMPPGLLRKTYGFFHHPLYDLDQHGELKKALQNSFDASCQKKSDACCAPIAIEKDYNGYRGILQSLTKAGFMGKARIVNTSFQAVSDRELKDLGGGLLPNFLIANPPYGVRYALMDEELRALYRDLGRFIKTKLEDMSTAALIFPEGGEGAKALSLAPKERHHIVQGGINCLFSIYDIFRRDR